MAQFGFGPASPAMDLMAAPPPAQPAPQAVAQPPQQAQAPQPFKPSFWDIAQGMLFDGSSPAEAAMAARSRAYAIQQNGMMMAALQNATPQQRLAMLLNPAKLGEEVSKNFAPINAGEGTTEVMFGGPSAGGGAFVAPKMGFDPVSGRGYTQTPGSTTPTGPSLGGGFKATDGLVMSDRTGPTGSTYSTPQIVPAGSSGVGFTPGLNGGPGAASAQAGQPTGGGGAAVDASAPRGIRNNNLLNVRALPNGQMWRGQTGVDPHGYAVFGTVEDGLHAAQTNLHSYAVRDGVQTLGQAIERWAPAAAGNATSAYGRYVSEKTGIALDQPINLADPKVQKPVMKAMAEFENGPQAIAAWRRPKAGGGQGGGSMSVPPPPAPPNDNGPSVQAAGGGFGQPFAQGKGYTIVPAGDPAYANLPKGTVLQQAPTGERSILQHPEFGPAENQSRREGFTNSEAYKALVPAASALQALQGNLGKMNGPAAYTILDTMARTINPGAVARQGTISAIEDMFGLPAHVVGTLQNITGKGKIPLETQQQIIDAVIPFAQAHWDQAKTLYDANAKLAASHGVKPEEWTAPIGERPKSYNIRTQGKAPDEVRAQAKAAIAQGKDRNMVIQRVQSMGINPAGL